jgi:hypothetical protein
VVPGADQRCDLRRHGDRGRWPGGLRGPFRPGPERTRAVTEPGYRPAPDCLRPSLRSRLPLDEVDDPPMPVASATALRACRAPHAATIRWQASGPGWWRSASRGCAPGRTPGYPLTATGPYAPMGTARAAADCRRQPDPAMSDGAGRSHLAGPLRGTAAGLPHRVSPHEQMSTPTRSARRAGSGLNGPPSVCSHCRRGCLSHGEDRHPSWRRSCGPALMAGHVIASPADAAHHAVRPVTRHRVGPVGDLDQYGPVVAPG